MDDLTWVPKASAIAREAGARLREFQAQGVETEYKGDVDLVTVADRTAENLIRERLATVFPEHGVYGEEGTRERLEGIPLVCGPAGWDYELCSRHSALLCFAGVGAAPGRAQARGGRNTGGWGHLRSDAG